MQQTVQLISMGGFSYQDLLTMEIKDREEHYKAFTKYKKDENDALSNSFMGLKKGFSRFRR